MIKWIQLELLANSNTVLDNIYNEVAIISVLNFMNEFNKLTWIKTCSLRLNEAYPIESSTLNRITSWNSFDLISS